jgi:hypothetical protein
LAVEEDLVRAEPNTSPARTLYRPLARIVRRDWVWAAAILLVLAASMCWLLRNRVNGDVSWYLHLCQQLAAGTTVYRDIGDMNPPLIYGVNLLVVRAAQTLHVAPHVVLFAALWTLGLWILWCCGRILLAIDACSRAWTFALLLFLALDFGIFDRHDFGQRDHILAFCFLPFALTVAARIDGLSHRVVSSLAVALVVGLAIALKPFFLLPWLMVMAYLAYRMGVAKTLRTPEFWLVLLINGAYVVSVLLVFPEYLGIAATAAKYYGAYNGNPAEFVPLLILGVAIVVVLLGVRVRPTMRPVLAIAGIAAIGFAIEAAIQRKGFSYHLIPAQLFEHLAIALVVVDVVQGPFRRRLLYWKPTLLLAAACCLPVLAALKVGTGVDRDLQAELRSFLAKNPPNGPALVLSHNLHITFPAIYDMNLRMAQRNGLLWPVLGMYSGSKQGMSILSGSHAPIRYHSAAEMSDTERALFDDVRRALVEKRPPLIIADSDGNPTGGWGDFDILRYFSTDPEIRRELQAYKPSGCCFSQRASAALVLVRRSLVNGAETAGEHPSPRP